MGVKRLSAQRRSWAMALCVAFVMLLLLVPNVMAQGLLNWGNLLLSHAVVEHGKHLNYSLWRLGNHSQAAQAQQVFEAVLHFPHNDSDLDWHIGRAALATGHATEAARALTVEAAVSEPFNTIRFLNTLEAQSRAGNDAEVLALYDHYQTPPVPFDGQLIRNTVALAYLHLAQIEIAAGHLEAARPLLDKAREFRPFDLYANYWLWKIALPDSAEAEESYRQFFYFAPEAVKPEPDTRFLELFFTVFPEVLAEDQWGEARSVNLMNYWIWQHPDWPSLGDLLDLLIVQSPTQSVWKQLQGERYRRLGQTDLAESYDQMALARQPNDNLALDRLNERSSLNQLLSASPSSDPEIVAHMLGLPIEAVDIGTNQIQTTSIPVLSFTVAGGATSWPFVAGPDPIEQPSVLRILNLWWPAADHISGFTPYGNYLVQKFEINTKWIMVSLLYKVDGDANRFGFLGIVNAQAQDWHPYLASVNLPVTSGQWVRAVLVAKVPQPDTQWLPILRNWGAASAWFDKLEIFPLTLTGEPNHCTQEPCVYFQSLGQW